MTCTRYTCLIVFIFFIGCGEKNKNNKNENSGTGKGTIPFARTNVAKEPVAAYVIPMGDPKLDRKFGVEVYETPETFKYLLVMYYDGTIQEDTLTVPDIGIWPVVKVKPGTEKLSCIIGFLDNKNEFREYKMLHAKGNNLRLTTLKHYDVATN